jgi:hypothetical protein
VGFSLPKVGSFPFSQVRIPQQKEIFNSITAVAILSVLWISRVQEEETAQLEMPDEKLLGHYSIQIKQLGQTLFT